MGTDLISHNKRVTKLKPREGGEEELVTWIDGLKSRFSSTLRQQDEQLLLLRNSNNMEAITESYRNKIFDPFESNRSMLEGNSSSVNYEGVRKLHLSHKDDNFEDEAVSEIIDLEESDHDDDTKIYNDDDDINYNDDDDNDLLVEIISGDNHDDDSVEESIDNNIHSIEDESEDSEKDQVVSQQYYTGEEPSESNVASFHMEENNYDGMEVDDEVEDSIQADAIQSALDDHQLVQNYATEVKDPELQHHVLTAKDTKSDDEMKDSLESVLESELTAENNQHSGFYNLENLQFETYEKPIDSNHESLLALTEAVIRDYEINSENINNALSTIDNLRKEGDNETNPQSEEQFKDDQAEGYQSDDEISVSSNNEQDNFSLEYAPVPQPFTIADNNIIQSNATPDIASDEMSDVEDEVDISQDKDVIHSNIGEPDIKSITTAEEETKEDEAEEKEKEEIVEQPEEEGKEEEELDAEPLMSGFSFKTVAKESPLVVLQQLKETEAKFDLSLKSRKDLQIDLGIDPLEDFLKRIYPVDVPVLDEVPSEPEEGPEDLDILSAKIDHASANDDVNVQAIGYTVNHDDASLDRSRRTSIDEERTIIPEIEKCELSSALSILSNNQSFETTNDKEEYEADILKSFEDNKNKDATPRTENNNDGAEQVLESHNEASSGISLSDTNKVMDLQNTQDKGYTFEAESIDLSEEPLTANVDDSMETITKVESPMDHPISFGHDANVSIPHPKLQQLNSSMVEDVFDTSANEDLVEEAPSSLDVISKPTFTDINLSTNIILEEDESEKEDVDEEVQRIEDRLEDDLKQNEAEKGKEPESVNENKNEAEKDSQNKILRDNLNDKDFIESSDILELVNNEQKGDQKSSNGSPEVEFALEPEEIVVEYPDGAEIEINDSQIIHPTEENEPEAIEVTEPEVSNSENTKLYEQLSKTPSNVDTVATLPVVEEPYEEPKFSFTEELDIESEERMITPSEITRPLSVEPKSTTLKFDITNEIIDGEDVVEYRLDAEYQPNIEDSKQYSGVTRKRALDIIDDSELLGSFRKKKKLSFNPLSWISQVFGKKSSNGKIESLVDEGEKFNIVNEGEEQSDVEDTVKVNVTDTKENTSMTEISQQSVVNEESPEEDMEEVEDEHFSDNKEHLNENNVIADQGKRHEEPQTEDSELNEVGLDALDTPYIAVDETDNQRIEEDNGLNANKETFNVIEQQNIAEKTGEHISPVDDLDDSTIDDNTKNDSTEKETSKVIKKSEDDEDDEDDEEEDDDEGNEEKKKDEEEPKVLKLFGLEIHPEELEPEHSLRDGHKFGDIAPSEEEIGRRPRRAKAKVISYEIPPLPSLKSKGKSQPSKVKKAKKKVSIINTLPGSPKKASTAVSKSKGGKLETGKSHISFKANEDSKDEDNLKVEPIDNPAHRTRSKSPLKEDLRDLINEKLPKPRRSKRKIVQTATEEELESDQQDRGRSHKR